MRGYHRQQNLIFYQVTHAPGVIHQRDHLGDFRIHHGQVRDCPGRVPQQLQIHEQSLRHPEL